LHSCAEDAGLGRHAELADRLDEALVERLGALGPCHLVEARAVASPRVREQREVRDDERGAADLEERADEPPVGALEDPEAGALPREPLCRGLAVVGGDAEEDAEPRADLAARRRAGARDALDDGPHSESSSSRMRAAYWRFVGFIELASL